MGLGNWLDERTGHRGALRTILAQPVAGGPSFAYVMGSVLLGLLLLQATTGVLLAFYYSPSATDAWASVAYVEDQVTLGWLIRGVHHHGASALVIALGVHLLQAVVWGAYKPPREVAWWLGVLLVLLIMAFALTGDLLPWDQNGYWATKIRVGYVAAAPGGADVQAAMLGGNDLGNLTLTRFFALHVLVLPVALGALVALHVLVHRKHGVTPRWGRGADELARATRPYWPAQAFRNAVAVVVAMAALVGWTIYRDGAGLSAPADPSAAFDARPAWFERPLFQLVRSAPASLEGIVAMVAPLLGGAVLLALPLLDRGAERSPLRRAWVLALVLGGLVGVGALTVMSYRADAADPELAERRVAAERMAHRARVLAREHGVPAAGGTAVYTTAPFYRARTLWAEHCDSCHAGDDRKGPLIGPGYNSRAWIRGLLVAPSSDPYFGRTKLAATEDAMPDAEATGADLDALVEMVYAESGAPDVDRALAAKGQQLFDEGPCADCHERTGQESSSGPNLAGRGSAAYLRSFIRDSGQAHFFGPRHEMTVFTDELSPADLAALAEWVLWLRTATAEDLERLDP